MLLGHELQHGAEIADNPSVVKLYRRIGDEGQRSSRTTSFDTTLAREIGYRVRSEVRRAPPEGRIRQALSRAADAD